MPNEPITQREYWDEVESLAQTIREEAEEYSRDVSDVLFETIDGHQWVIYTAFHYEVLSHSDNDDYYVENFGAEGLSDGTGLRTDRLAWGALYGDVSDKVYA